MMKYEDDEFNAIVKDLEKEMNIEYVGTNKAGISKSSKNIALGLMGIVLGLVIILVGLSTLTGALTILCGVIGFGVMVLSGCKLTSSRSRNSNHR